MLEGDWDYTKVGSHIQGVKTMTRATAIQKRLQFSEAFVQLIVKLVF